MIPDEAVKKVPRIKYKNIPESEYNTIQELVRQVLKISKDENDSNEVAITYDMDTMERIQKREEYIGVVLGSEHEVDPMSSTISYHLIVSAKECIILVSKKFKELTESSRSLFKELFYGRSGLW